MDITQLHDWMQFHTWRVHKICDHLANFPNMAFLQPIKGSFPSFSHLLGHMASAESIWLARMNNTVEKFPKYDYFENVDVAANTWKDVAAQLIQKLNTLSQEDLSGSFSYENNSGKTFSNRYDEALYHLFDHTTYHTGQIAWIYRQFDIAPVSTNYIFYLREKQA